MMIRSILFSLFVIGPVILQAQMRDAAFYQRIDQRVEIMQHHFRNHITDDRLHDDTVAYAQRILANHLETIRLRTQSAKNQKPMYAYALKLHKQRLASILPAEILQKYFESFNAQPSGFSFCRICNMAQNKTEKGCGNCGEIYNSSP